MIAVYTCVVGDYDSLIRQPSYPGVQYFCFSKIQFKHQLKGWNMIPLESPADLVDQSLINRFHKICRYDFFQNTEYSVYIDGNILLKTNPSLFAESLREADMRLGAFKHPQRSTIQQELEACISQKKFLENEVKEVKNIISDMKDKGFRNQNGLSGNYILVRKQDDKLLAEAMTDWWLIVSQKIKRDQLSLQFILWSKKISWFAIDDCVNPKKAFLQIPHGLYINFLPLEVQIFLKKCLVKLKLILKI